MNAKRILAGMAATVALPTWVLAAAPVVVDPVKVEIDRNWIYEMKEYRAKGGPGEAEAKAFGADLAASLRAEIEKAVRAQGFDVVSAPATGAIRISARIDNLYVNALETTTPVVRSATRQAGRATLRAEGRGPGGAVLLQAEQRAETADPGRFEHATNVSNRFWFESLFRGWAAEVARDLKAKAPN